MLASHMSRFAEEIVIWMSQPYQYVSLSDKFTTGSSIMPQKRNPDAAELIRGKTGRFNGNLISLLTTMKSLPLAYSKDMQEDKEPVFDSNENIQLCIAALDGMVQDLSINKQAMLDAAQMGYLTATDLADWLVTNAKLPFRQAHKITGEIVAYASKNNLNLEDIELSVLQKFHKNISKDIYKAISLENSLNSRKSDGGTATAQVEKALKQAAKKLKK